MYLKYVSQHAFFLHFGCVTTHPTTQHVRCAISPDAMRCQVPRELLRKKDIVARLSTDYPPTGVGLLSARKRKIAKHCELILDRPVIVELGIDLVVRHEL